MERNNVVTWSELLQLAVKHSWPWLVAAIVIFVPLVFGDIRGYIGIADYLSTHKWFTYVLLVLPFICILLAGAVKAFGDELINTNTLANGSPKPLYKRIKMHAHRQVDLDGSVTALNSVEMEVTSDSLVRSIQHRRTVRESEMFHDATVEFRGGTLDNSGDMQFRILNISPKTVLWSLDFSPALTFGQRATYSYKQTSKDSFFVTLDQIRDDITADTRTSDYDYWRFRVTVPTDELLMKIEFPFNYPITFPASGGYNIYLENSEDVEEVARIRTEKCFSAVLDPLNNRWTLQLLVPAARLGLTYALEWVPPPRKIIEHLLV